MKTPLASLDLASISVDVTFSVVCTTIHTILNFAQQDLLSTFVQCCVLSKFKTNGCSKQFILNIQHMVHTIGKLSAQFSGTLVENTHPRGGDCKGVTWQKHIYDEVQTCRIIKDRLWERKKTFPLGWAGGLFLKIFICFLRYFNHGYYLVNIYRVLSNCAFNSFARDVDRHFPL